MMKLRLLSRLYIAPHIKPIDLICKRLEHATVLTYYTTTLSLFLTLFLFLSLSLSLSLSLYLYLLLSLTLTHHNSLFLYHSEQTIFEQDLSLSLLPSPIFIFFYAQVQHWGPSFCLQGQQHEGKSEKICLPTFIHSSVRLYERIRHYVVDCHF